MNKKIVIANWKCNPVSIQEAVEIALKVDKTAGEFENLETVIAPPYPFLAPLAKVVKKSKLGVQNISWQDKGALTGEVSWKQVKEFGANYAILGHSERRIFLGETDEMIKKKVEIAIQNGMNPILCVGEREKAQENEIPDIVGEQLKAAVKGISNNLAGNLIVAYEPVWAISTMPGARPDIPANAYQAKLYIRKILADIFGRETTELIRIIYGGSVREDNIEGFIKEGKMEGALVGGASLRADEFGSIIKKVSAAVKSI